MKAFVRSSCAALSVTAFAVGCAERIREVPSGGRAASQATAEGPAVGRTGAHSDSADGQKRDWRALLERARRRPWLRSPDAGEGPRAEKSGQMTRPTKTDVPRLISDLSDKDDFVRSSAALDLTEIGPEAVAAVPALTKALRDEDEFVREWAIDALGNIGPPARSAVPHIIKALWNVDNLTRD